MAASDQIILSLSLGHRPLFLLDLGLRFSIGEVEGNWPVKTLAGADKSCWAEAFVFVRLFRRASLPQRKDRVVDTRGLWWTVLHS